MFDRQEIDKAVTLEQKLQLLGSWYSRYLAEDKQDGTTLDIHVLDGLVGMARRETTSKGISLLEASGAFWTLLEKEFPGFTFSINYKDGIVYRDQQPFIKVSKVCFIYSLMESSNTKEPSSPSTSSEKPKSEG